MWFLNLEAHHKAGIFQTVLILDIWQQIQEISQNTMEALAWKTMRPQWDTVRIFFLILKTESELIHYCERSKAHFKTSLFLSPSTSQSAPFGFKCALRGSQQRLKSPQNHLFISSPCCLLLGTRSSGTFVIWDAISASPAQASPFPSLQLSARFSCSTPPQTSMI